MLGLDNADKRRALRSMRDKSDYDHLSRYGEWDLSDLPEGGR